MPEFSRVPSLQTEHEPRASSRIALITLADDGEAPRPSIGGRSLAERQVGMARDLGCTEIVVLSRRHNAEAAAVRHTAEKLGFRCRHATSVHGLLGLAEMEGTLTVIQQGLLGQHAPTLRHLQDEGAGVLTIPAGGHRETGWERLDAASASAGLFAMPSGLVSGLRELPADADPFASLLRIALQSGVQRLPMGEGVLETASWTLIADDETGRSMSHEWLSNAVRPSSFAGPTRSLASRLAIRVNQSERDWASIARLAAMLAALFMGMALYVGLQEAAWAGLLLLAVAALPLELSLAMDTVRALRPRHLFWHGAVRFLPVLAAATIGLHSIDSLLWREVFPPAVFLLAFITLDRRQGANWARWLTDRGIVALALGGLAFALGVEPAFMIVSLALMVPLAIGNADNAGLTKDG